jgi:midasin (ATPase involved in ribosome maturation)
MFKVDEYLRRANLARACAKTASEIAQAEYHRLASEWDDLASERLSFLEQKVRDRVISWRELEADAARNIAEGAASAPNDSLAA